MKNLLLFFCSLVATAATQAQIIHVPGDYPTIQSGINAAYDGDTVLVADSIYYEQINFHGKKIMVASQFLMDGDTNHIANTIIDGSQPPNPDSASVVYFVSGEDTTSILCGFTITGGTGTTLYTPSWMWNVAREGGGIWISGSGAKIRNNIITRNGCTDINRPNVMCDIGGGIATQLDQDDFWIVIENNVIDSNYVISDTSAGCSTSGGIAIINNCRIINNIIKNNVAKNLVNTVWWSQGAGACIFSCDSLGNPLNKIGIIQNNQFLNNINNSNNAFGGGMKAGNMHLTISHNTFMGNRVESDISMNKCWGAGLEAYRFLEGSIISCNTFKENYSEETDAGLVLSSDLNYAEPLIVENNYFFNNIAEGDGGAFGVYNCPVIFQNNVFNANEAGFAAAGHLYNDISQNGHTVWFKNNSFSHNKAVSCGSINAFNTRSIILNCIFWKDSANFTNELYDSGNGEFEIAYSDIDTNAILGQRILGAGVIKSDPLFSDTTLLTTEHWSPCVDKGVAQYTCLHGQTVQCPQYDILGNLRPVGSGYDIGAYDIQAWGQGVERIMNDELRITNYPDPFIESTTFAYTLKEKSQVTLQIFNSFGQMVIEPVNTIQPKGDQKVVWNAKDLPAGIYYCHLQAGKQGGSGKMMKW